MTIIGNMDVDIRVIEVTGFKPEKLSARIQGHCPLVGLKDICKD